MFDKLVNFQIKYSKIIVFLFILFTLFMSTHAVNLTIDPSFSVLVSSDSEFNTNERVITNTFEVNNAFTVLVEVDESSILRSRSSVIDDDAILYLERLSSIMKESQYVRSVSPVEVSDDERFARIILGVAVPRSAVGTEEVSKELDNFLSEAGSIPGFSTSITGFPLLLNRVNTLLIRDNLKAILFTITTIFLGLYWYFRNLKYSLLALSIPLSCLIILAGAMSLLNIPLTITLAAVGILILGLGIDYTIHVVLGYNNSVDEVSKVKAIHETVDHLSKAIFVSYATTVAGFSALMFGISPSSQSQGLVLTIGISIIFIATIAIIPSFLYLFGYEKKVMGNLLFRKIKSKIKKISFYQADHPKKIIFIICLITIFFVIGASQVEISTSNNNWVPDDDPVSQDFRTSAFAFGTDFDSVTLVLTSERGDFRDVQKVRDIQFLEELLLSHKEIESISSPFSDLELEQSSIVESLNQRSNSFNSDFTLTRISITATNLGGDETGDSAVFDDIVEMVEKNPVLNTKVSFFGDTVRFRELGISLGRDTGITTVISFIFVFLIASIAYASYKIGMVALFPVIIGIIWTVGIMGYAGVPFTALSTGLIALVLGIGVDFSIHLVNSTYNYLGKGMDLKSALTKTLDYTGTPILLSSITTFIGFSSLLFATLLGIQRLGISLALSIISVFIVTIVLVPAIISLTQRNK
ncbi:MAG: efflux RND transporter permease subunit [Candidatus Woesearchaeota archaeon]